MPTLIIDGKEITVEDGLNIIEAASRVGVEIPHFCYHPALSVVAQCRQCLVEIEGVPKVMPACNTYVREGLIVKTDSTKALKAREATVEFTLINHPLDCPICDKGGECPLQLTTVGHGPGKSRFEGPEEKKVRRKYYLSEQILYDPNRCIMCTRCIRFTDEITKTGELGYEGRGFRKKIAVFPGKPLDNELAGNVTDICPVGALLDKSTLHKERVWYWEFADSVCSLCSNGCNITVGVDPRKGKVSRVRPRVNTDVNGYWICDRGRYGFEDIQENPLRLRDPIIRGDNGYEVTSWDAAVDAAGSILRSASDTYPVYSAIIGAPTLTNEEIYLLKKISHVTKIENLSSEVGVQDREKLHGLISSDPYPNSAGVMDFGLVNGANILPQVLNDLLEGNLKALYICGADLFKLVTEDEHERLRNNLAKLNGLVVQDYKMTETAKYAHVILPGASPYEKDGTFTNDRGRIQRIRKAIEPPGIAKADWEILCLIGQYFQDFGFTYQNTSEIMDEIAQSLPEYSGLNHEIIGELGTNKTVPSQ